MWACLLSPNNVAWEFLKVENCRTPSMRAGKETEGTHTSPRTVSAPSPAYWGSCSVVWEAGPRFPARGVLWAESPSPATAGWGGRQPLKGLGVLLPSRVSFSGAR